MSNIKNLQMWKDICADARISVSKSLFGLKTTAMYVPTQSVIDAEIYEYTQKDGDRLLRILTGPREELAKAIGDFSPKPITNGNYLLEVVHSRDNQFAALLLKQYQQLNYELVTTTLIFEGEEVQTISRLFQK